MFFSTGWHDYVSIHPVSPGFWPRGAQFFIDRNAFIADTGAEQLASHVFPATLKQRLPENFFDQFRLTLLGRNHGNQQFTIVAGGSN